MNRIIKFRGLTMSGEWVYGLLSQSFGKTGQPPAGWYICNTVGMTWAYEVRPETIGQITGQNDRIGVPIYEGDFVEGNTTRFTRNYIGSNDRGKDFRGVVEYSGAGFRIKFANQIIIDRFGGTTGLFLSTMDHIKVIGNIYENENLLKNPLPNGK